MSEYWQFELSLQVKISLINIKHRWTGLPDRLLTPKQVAEELNVSVWTVYRLIKRGDLVAIRVGRLLRIPESSLEAFIDLRRVNIK